MKKAKKNYFIRVIDDWGVVSSYYVTKRELNLIVKSKDYYELRIKAVSR